jgi:hypothetical protein
MSDRESAEMATFEQIQAEVASLHAEAVKGHDGMWRVTWAGSEIALVKPHPFDDMARWYATLLADGFNQMVADKSGEPVGGKQPRAEQ